jgi:hypothetical protein
MLVENADIMFVPNLSSSMRKGSFIKKNVHCFPSLRNSYQKDFEIFHHAKNFAGFIHKSLMFPVFKIISYNLVRKSTKEGVTCSRPPSPHECETGSNQEPGVFS